MAKGLLKQQIANTKIVKMKLKRGKRQTMKVDRQMSKREGTRGKCKGQAAKVNKRAL